MAKLTRKIAGKSRIRATDYNDLLDTIFHGRPTGKGVESGPMGTYHTPQDPDVRFGRPKAAYTGGNTLTLRECDRNGAYYSANADLFNIVVYTGSTGDDVISGLISEASTDTIFRYIPHPEDDYNVAGVIVGPTELSHTILIENTSGVNITACQILGIDAAIVDPTADLPEFKRRVAISGITPTTAAHTGLFVIAAQDILSGAKGSGYAAGVCPVKINVTSTDHDFADVTNNERDYLTSGVTGAAQILLIQGGTGLKWAVVRLSFGGVKTHTLLNAGVHTDTLAKTPAANTVVIGTDVGGGVYKHTITESSVTNYQVLTIIGGVAVWDYVRFVGP